MKSFENKLKKESEKKAKIAYLTQYNKEWKPGQTQEYMRKLNRIDASMIFKAKTRMLDVKQNFKGKYKDLKCRACDQHNNRYSQNAPAYMETMIPK